MYIYISIYISIRERTHRKVLIMCLYGFYMENFDIYLKLGLDTLVLITFVWTIYQEWRLRRKVSYSETLSTKDIEDITLIMDKINADLRELKGRMTTTKMEVFDYVEQQLKPIARRLSTRAFREKDAQEELLDNKKGGIIPYPNGITKQSQ
jgi:hypothetical protein